MVKKVKLREVIAGNKMSIPDFILLALFSVGSKKGCTFERLLKECYNLSPSSFCFPANTKWPDARKIDRPLRTLRRKGLVKGSPDSSFSLTQKGKRVAEELAKLLRQKKLFKD